MPTLIGTINNFENGQQIFRRESVEILIARIRLLEDHIAAEQKRAADLPTRCPSCEELTVYGSSCHNALCPSAIR